jgi:hypothetical protein
MRRHEERNASTKKCVDMIPIAAISAVRRRRWPWVSVLERGVRWVCRAIVQDRRQTLLCQAVAHFLQLAGDPQSLDLESSIAIQQSAGCDQGQRERSLIHHLRHLYVL